MITGVSMKLPYLELNKRCREVFSGEFGDTYTSLEIVGTTAIVHLEKVDPYCNCNILSSFVRDMSDRPTALEYLKGNCTGFND